MIRKISASSEFQTQATRAPPIKTGGKIKMAENLFTLIYQISFSEVIKTRYLW